MFRWLATLAARISALGTVQLPKSGLEGLYLKEALKGFPTFKSVFEVENSRLPAYYELLNIESTSGDVIKSIRRAVRTSPHLDDELVAMLLSELGWRIELIGLVALAVVGYRSRPVEALWKTFDEGSWLAPQLAAGASIVDPDFRAKANARLERVNLLAVAAEPTFDDLSLPAS